MEKFLNIMRAIWELFKSRNGKRVINFIVTFIGIFFYLLLIIGFKIQYGQLDEYIIFLLIPIFMLIISNILDTRKKETKKNIILMLLLNVVFVGSLIYANTGGIKTGLYLNGIKYYNYNLIPFNTLKAILIDGIDYGLYSNFIFYNLIMFIGFSILLPLINKKFEKSYIFIITIIVIGFLYEGIEYLFMIGSFDIDMIILRTIGSFLIFLVIYKTKMFDKIISRLSKIKVNAKVLNFFYIGLFIILIIIASERTFNYLNQENIKKVSISGALKCGLEEIEVGVIDNYRYYTKCQGDYSIVCSNWRLTLKEFIETTPNITKYMDRFKLRREKFITEVKVIENSLAGKKLVREYDDIKEYYYNIESIKVRVDNNTYNYEDYLKDFSPNELDLTFTRDKFFRSNQDNYAFYTGEYYNSLYCHESMYYLPKTYKINKNTCKFLNKI